MRGWPACIYLSAASNTSSWKEKTRHIANLVGKCNYTEVRGTKKHCHKGALAPHFTPVPFHSIFSMIKSKWLTSCSKGVRHKLQSVHSVQIITRDTDVVTQD